MPSSQQHAERVLVPVSFGTAAETRSNWGEPDRRAGRVQDRHDGQR